MSNHYEYKTSLPDKNAIYAFYKEIGWNDNLKLSADALFEAMQHSYYSLYVYQDNKLVATVRLVSDGVISAYLCGLGVLKEHRNKGIARQLVEMVADFCKERGLHLQFFCEAELTTFYEKLGFLTFATGMKMKD